MKNWLTTRREFGSRRVVEIDDFEEKSVDVGPVELPLSTPILHIAFIFILILVLIRFHLQIVVSSQILKSIIILNRRSTSIG